MITKHLGWALAFAAAMLVGAAGLRYAANLGLLGPDGTRRATQIVIGLALAVYANFMPKQTGRLRQPVVEQRTQTALRIGGWSFSLSGLIYAGLWAFAPLAIADIGSLIAVASAMVLTMGFAIWTYWACRGAAATLSR